MINGATPLSLFSGQKKIYIQRQTNGNRGINEHYKDGFKKFEPSNRQVTRYRKDSTREFLLFSRESHRFSFLVHSDGSAIEACKYV